MLDPLVADHLELLLGGGIAERGPQEESVELRLGQRERSLVLDGVLGREQQEGAWDGARGAVDGHLSLGHRLEERGLGLRHRAVDLVDEDDVGEDRARAELEVPDALVVDRQAGDIGRLEIRRALDARADRALDRLGDGAREHGLRRARHVLEEHVAVAGERRQDEADLVALPVHDRLDVREQPVGDLDGLAQKVGLGNPGGHADECSPALQGATGLGRLRVDCGKRRLDRGRAVRGRQDLDLTRPEPLAADLAHHGVAHPRVGSIPRRERLLGGRRHSCGCAASVAPPSVTASSAAADATFATTRVGMRRRGTEIVTGRGSGWSGAARSSSVIQRLFRSNARHAAHRVAWSDTARRSSSERGASSCRESSARVRSQDGP